MYKGHTVSVVIPCFNEEHGIAAVLKGMPDYVDQVVVVDNNSTDETGRIAKDMNRDLRNPEYLDAAGNRIFRWQSYRGP